MTRPGLARWLSLCAAAVVAASSGAPARGPQATETSALDQAFSVFWSASDAEASARAADDILTHDPGFDETRRRLERGRGYDASVPSGRLRRRHATSDGLTHNYTLFVPERYDPEHRYPVRVQLHGGIDTTFRNRAARIDEERIEPGYIHVFPSGWREAQWWHANQLENLVGILDRLKRTYNVDENRVHLSGISDGGSGVYFIAAKETTLWAAFCRSSVTLRWPPIQRWVRTATCSLGTSSTSPSWRSTAAPIGCIPHRESSHTSTGCGRLASRSSFGPTPNTGTTCGGGPASAMASRRSSARTPAIPSPTGSRGKTDRSDRYQRAHWLVIERLGAAPSDPPREMIEQMFRRTRPSGRVDLARTGNRIDVATWGVRRYTLLLSPDEIDFGRPVTVVTNGTTSFEGRVERDVATLLRWAARDNDRTALFGGEITIDVAGSGDPR